MIAAPAITPITRATCCFHGVASTSWPVFRSCRLLLAMAAAANTTAVTNSAKATSACWPLAGTLACTLKTSSRAAPMTTRIPIPESGLLEEPISPAMYPQTAETKKLISAI